MSDDQDTTAPGRVGIAIKRVEVTTGDDPDRFVHSLAEAFKREASVTGYSGAPTGRRVVGLFYVPWRKRIAKAALFVAWGCVTSLAILGACWLLGVPRP